MWTARQPQIKMLFTSGHHFIHGCCCMVSSLSPCELVVLLWSCDLTAPSALGSVARYFITPLLRHQYAVLWGCECPMSNRCTPHFWVRCLRSLNAFQALMHSIYWLFSMVECGLEHTKYFTLVFFGNYLNRFFFSVSVCGFYFLVFFKLYWMCEPE